MTSKKSKTHFRYQKQLSLPPLKNIKTEWDLATLYYGKDATKKIEADLKATEAAFMRFAKKWRKKPFTSDMNLLKQALTEYETLSADPTFTRPSRYYWLRTCLNVNDSMAERQRSLITRRLRMASDEILFFSLQLGAVPAKQQKQILREPTLSHFHYHLQRLFRGAVHQLSEAEEKIVNLKGPQSYGMWVNMTDKIISNRTINWEGEALHLPEAIERITVVPFHKKTTLWGKITNELRQISEVVEHEFNAIITDSHTENEKRGYKKPYSPTVIAYEDTEKNLEALVQTVTSTGFSISRDFYTTKAKLHHVPTLQYAERNAQIGNELSIPWLDAVDICRDVFHQLSPKYGQIFDTMLTQGQIDAFPRPGKQGGAFMSDQTGHPVQVMLNHTPTFSALETLAHEMGHAIHATRSGTQTSFYDGHSTITAETASTLFENLVFDAVYQQLTSDDQFYLLHDRLMRDISTIERQIAFFNLELAIHEQIISKGAITSTELRDVTKKHLQAYLGKGVSVTDNDAYSYVYVSHLRYGFYVYTYTFGLLMSTIMSERYKHDKSYIKEIDSFLQAGASASVGDIFASIGINTTDPNTFKEALATHKRAVHNFKSLAKKRL